MRIISKITKFFLIKYTKIISILFFLLLLGSYTHIFAINSAYYPGATFDPACVPRETNCTVKQIDLSDVVINTVPYVDSSKNIVSSSVTPTELSYISGVTSRIQTQLNGKQTILTSGLTIKTINSTTVLGSGDIAVQPTLVSGTNIKSINSNSLLGAGNISIATLIGYTPYNATNPNSYIPLTSLSSSAPLSYNNTTGAFTISQSNTSTNGYLSSTDWNTFNNKQPSNSNLTSLGGLTYASGAFVKMTGANTFTLDTNSYITSLSGALLATGATTGATSQAQAFTNGIKTGIIFPSSDSTTAIQFNKADGTTNILNIDTTNSRVGLGTATPNEQLELTGNFRLPATTSTTGIIYQGANTLLHTYGTSNYFLGTSAGNFTMTGTGNNIGIGDLSLNTNTTGDSNVGIGNQALQYNTTGSRNVGLGAFIERFNSTSNDNVGIGYAAIGHNDIGINNTGVGLYSLASRKIIGTSITTTFSFNSSFGYQSGYSIMTGQYNSSFGYFSFYNNKNGNDDVALGRRSLYQNTTGSQNVGLGHFALNFNTTGNNNTAVGISALADNANIAPSKSIISFTDYSDTVPGTTRATTSAAHGFVGTPTEAIFGSFNYDGIYTITVIDTTSFYFTATWVATESAYVSSVYSTGNNNTGLGFNTGVGIRSGSSNTIIGASVTGLSPTLANNVIIANGAGNKRISIDNNGNVGIANPSPAYRLHVGTASDSGIVARFQNGTGTCDINPTTTSLSCSSDQTLKKNITSIPDGLISKLTLLRPVTYNWNTEQNSTIVHSGFIAQEVEQIFPDLVTTDINTNLKSLNYIGFVPYIIKAFNEEDANVKNLDLKINGIASLDLSQSNSVASLTKSFLASATNNVDDLFTDTINTKNICVEDICMTKDQLDQVVALINSQSNNNQILAQ